MISASCLAFFDGSFDSFSILLLAVGLVGALATAAPVGRNSMENVGSEDIEAEGVVSLFVLVALDLRGTFRTYLDLGTATPFSSTADFFGLPFLIGRSLRIMLESSHSYIPKKKITYQFYDQRP